MYAHIWLIYITKLCLEPRPIQISAPYKPASGTYMAQIWATSICPCSVHRRAMNDIDGPYMVHACPVYDPNKSNLRPDTIKTVRKSMTGPHASGATRNYAKSLFWKFGRGQSNPHVKARELIDCPRMKPR